MSDQLNTRIDLDSYVDLARDRAQRTLQVCGRQLDEVNGRVRTIVAPAMATGAKLAEPIMQRASHVVPASIESMVKHRAVDVRHFVDGLVEQIMPRRAADVGHASLG